MLIPMLVTFDVGEIFLIITNSVVVQHATSVRHQHWLYLVPIAYFLMKCRWVKNPIKNSAINTINGMKFPLEASFAAYSSPTRSSAGIFILCYLTIEIGFCEPANNFVYESRMKLRLARMTNQRRLQYQVLISF